MKRLIATAVLAATMPVAAQAQTFDFEDAGTQPTSTYSTTQSGLTLTLSRRNGKEFDFKNLSVDVPSFGTRSLSPFSDQGFGAFVADFSSDLTFFSVQMGDVAPSDPDDMTLTIFSGLGGTGTPLGSTSFAYGFLGFPEIATLSLSSATPFRSAVFNGGSNQFPNSVFYDNITVTQIATAVPEPATWATMILGFGVVGASLRSRRRHLADRVGYTQLSHSPQ